MHNDTEHTYTGIDRGQELFPAISLDPPSIGIPFQSHLSLVDLTFQPQADFAISDQTACYRHVKVKNVALVSYIQDVPGIGGTWR